MVKGKVIFEVRGSRLENCWIVRCGGSAARLFSLVSLVWYVGMVKGKVAFMFRGSLAREARAARLFSLASLVRFDVLQVPLVVRLVRGSLIQWLVGFIDHFSCLVGFVARWFVV